VRIVGPGPGARFGWSLAADTGGELLAVGAPNDSPPDRYAPFEARTRRGSVSLLRLAPSAGSEGRPGTAGPAPEHVLSLHGEDPRDHLGHALCPGPTPGTFWAGALAWPGVEATELGRVYAVRAER
jgi:hypothetical protein